MADYLKIFSNKADYDEYIEAGYPKPNVSYIEDTDETIFTNYQDAAGQDTIVESIKVEDYDATSNYKKEFRFPYVLKSVVIPEGITSIPDNTFSYNPSMSGTPDFPLESIQFPSTLTTLGSSNFCYNTSLKEIDLSGTLITEIARDPSGRGRGMFRGCTALESVKLPSTVTRIGGEAFYSCTLLDELSFPSSLTNIEGGAFYGSALKSADLSGTQMTGVDDGAFYGCSTLESVKLPSTLQWITKNNANNANNGAFGYCNHLTAVDMSGTAVTNIGTKSFYHCTALASVTFPSALTAIQASSFANCTSLTSVDIPASVTSIGNGAFQSCSALTSVTVRATTPPTLGTNVFDRTNANLVIYVPAESVDAYKAATNWSTYASRIQAIPA